MRGFFGSFLAVWLLLALVGVGISGTVLYFGFQQVTVCWVNKNPEKCWFD